MSVVCSECRLCHSVLPHSLQVAMLITDIPGACVLWQSSTRRKVCLWQTRRVSKFQRQSIQAWLATHALAQVVSHLDRITLFFSRCPAQLPLCLAADQCTARTSSTLTPAQLLHCIASHRNGPRSTTETPRMDKMAAEGIRFTDFHAGYSVCTASRAALLVSSSHTISTNIHPHVFTRHPRTRAFSLIHPRLLPTDSALTRAPIHSSSHSLHIL